MTGACESKVDGVKAEVVTEKRKEPGRGSEAGGAGEGVTHIYMQMPQWNPLFVCSMKN